MYRDCGAFRFSDLPFVSTGDSPPISPYGSFPFPQIRSPLKAVVGAKRFHSIYARNNCRRRVYPARPSGIARRQLFTSSPTLWASHIDKRQGSARVMFLISAPVGQEDGPHAYPSRNRGVSARALPDRLLSTSTQRTHLQRRRMARRRCNSRRPEAQCIVQALGNVRARSTARARGGRNRAREEQDMKPPPPAGFAIICREIRTPKLGSESHRLDLDCEK